MCTEFAKLLKDISEEAEQLGKLLTKKPLVLKKKPPEFSYRELYIFRTKIREIGARICQKQRQ